MVASNQEKGDENEKILREYIEKNTSFPMHRGRLNKSKLLKQLGIESARQRPACAEMLNVLDEKIVAKKNAPTEAPDSNENESETETIKRLRSYINALHQKLAVKDAQLDAYRRNEASELLLTKTGKIIASPIKPSQASFDLQSEEKQ